MNNAYKELEKKCFWNPSVGNINPLDIQQVCNPKFKIEKSDKIATYGSCFAQHIGKTRLYLETMEKILSKETLIG